MLNSIEWIYVYNSISSDELWTEEAQGKYCYNYSHWYNNVKDQKDCQQRCLAKSNCVGITYLYKNTPSCYLCDSDKLSYAEMEYVFYRRPGTDIKHTASSILEFFVHNF